MKKTLFVLISVMVLSALVLSACAQPTAAPTAVPTKAPATEAPTVAPTVAPTEPPTPEPPTPTPPPDPVCELMENAPVVNAGDLGSPEKPIVITFVPSGDTGKITTAGQGIADCLNKMTGLSFTIEVGTSFAASIEAMGAEKAQVGFLNTFAILLAEAKYEIEPALAVLRKYNVNAISPDKDLAGTMLPYYRGQFITTVDSGIATFADLKGKNFCFVDPTSTSGYIVPNIILKANGIDAEAGDIVVTNAGSHNNVAIAVYKGDCDAGVTFIDVITDSAANLAADYPDIAEKVVPFAVTDPIPNDGVQFIKGFDETLKTAIVDGLLKMTEDDGGKYLLKSLYSINGLAKIDATFYDDFAAILLAAGVDPATLVK